VGVYFVTQNPSDLPDDVLAQLSNRVQHALRAYTPAEQKAVRAAAKAFRVNPAFDTEAALSELGVGEALVSFLDEDGVPEPVERAFILPPQSLIGATDPDSVQRLIAADEFDLKYREIVDRESAFEILTRANEELAQRRQEEAEAAEAEKQRQKEEAAAERQRQKDEAAAEKAAAAEARAAEKAAAAEAKAAEKAAAAEAKAAEKAAAERTKTARKAVNAASSSVMTAVSHNIVNSVTGGKTTSASTIAKRAATNALSSVMRSGSSAIIRGLFGTKK